MFFWITKHPIGGFCVVFGGFIMVNNRDKGLEDGMRSFEVDCWMFSWLVI